MLVYAVYTGYARYAGYAGYAQEEMTTEGNVWAQCVYKPVVYALGRRQARKLYREYESTSENTTKPSLLRFYYSMLL